MLQSVLYEGTFFVSYVPLVTRISAYALYFDEIEALARSSQNAIGEIAGKMRPSSINKYDSTERDCPSVHG